MKSLAIELFKDENSKPYSFKSKAMDRVCFEGGDKIPDTFNRIRIAPFGESTRNSEHLIEINPEPRRVYLYGNTRRIYHIQTSWRRNQANT